MADALTREDALDIRCAQLQRQIIALQSHILDLEEQIRSATLESKYDMNTGDEVDLNTLTIKRAPKPNAD